MITPVTIKIHADLLARIEAAQKGSSMTRHRTILSTINVGLKYSSLKRQMYQQQAVYGKKIRDARKDGIQTGITYSISCVAVIFLVAFIFIQVTS